MQRLMLALPALVLIAACNDRTDTRTTVGNEGATTEISTDTGNGVDNRTIQTPAMTGQDFANAAASSDAFEIAAGNLARAKASSKALKDFGDMMVTQHGESTAKLKQAVVQADPRITIDAKLSEEQQADLDALKAASGAGFDSLYKSQQVAAHQKALAAMEGYAAGGDVPALKDFASSTAPVVQKHLDKIQGM